MREMGNRKYFLDLVFFLVNIGKYWIDILIVFVKFKNKEKVLGVRNEEGFFGVEWSWGFVVYRSNYI